MDWRKVLAIVLAIVIGYALIRVAFWIIGLVFSALWIVVGLVVGGAIVYFLYRKFNNMLHSGKRLT